MRGDSTLAAPAPPGAEAAAAAEGGPLLLPAPVLAKALSVSLATLWRLQSAGKLPAPVRLGHAVRWRADEVRAWLAAGCPPRSAWESMPESAPWRGRPR